MLSSQKTERRARAARLLLALVCGSALTAGVEGPRPAGATEPAASAAPPPGGSRGAPHPRGAAEEATLERAETLAAQAFRAYQRGDHPAALTLYQEAYAAAPSADIAFNIARVYDTGLSDAGSALRHYREYLAAPDADPARIELALRRVAELTAPNLAPALAPASRAGRAPPGSPPPSPSAPSSAPRLGASLQEPSSWRREPPARPAGAEPWTPLRVGAIVASSLGLVGLGLGAGFGVAALSDAGTARDYCTGNRCSSQRGVDAAHAASKNADIATASFAVGGSLLAAGVALFWFQLDEHWASETLAAPAWTPLEADAPIGLGWSGRW